MSDELEPQFNPPSIVTDGDTLTSVASEETLATGNGAGHQDSQSAYQSLDVGPHFAICDVVLAEPQGRRLQRAFVLETDHPWYKLHFEDGFSLDTSTTEVFIARRQVEFISHVFT